LYKYLYLYILSILVKSIGFTRAEEVFMADRTDNEEIREFWDNLEEEIGEKIEIYTLGEYREGSLGMSTPKVGLFYLTQTAVYFQTFPKANWFASLIGGFTKKKKEEKGVTVKIPLEQIIEASVRKLSFLQRVFAPNLPLLELAFAEIGGEKKEMLIASDEKGSEIIKRINLYRE
jgi:hypothetical protein